MSFFRSVPDVGLIPSLCTFSTEPPLLLLHSTKPELILASGNYDIRQSFSSSGYQYMLIFELSHFLGEKTVKEH